MLEQLKGLNFLDPKFYIPVIIGVLVLVLVIWLAKKLFKFAIFLAIVALAVLIYFNMPSISVNGSVATLKVNGQEYVIDTKNVKLESEKTDGKTKIYLVSGTTNQTKIELPFSFDFAKKFIIDKLNPKDGN